jgi:LacI family transcriptional regulator
LKVYLSLYYICILDNFKQKVESFQKKFYLVIFLGILNKMTKGSGDMSKATMKDVAALANVGVGTVSRVINNSGPVKETTRKKVNAAITELNYEPDEYARGLKMKHTNTIALIIPTTWHPFFGEFAYYVETELSKSNNKVLICNSNGDPQKEYEYVQMVKQNKVDGIIGITYTDIDQYISSDLPFVSVDRHFTEDVSNITADNASGGKKAAQELINRGCQHLAYIGGYQETPNETKKRGEFFEKEVNRLGKKVSSLYMKEPIKDLKTQVRNFMKDHPTIDGVFCINDFLALDCLDVFSELDLNVPEDIQVIGFDGVKMAKERSYLLSTISQPIKQMAEKAVDLLLNIIDGKEVDRNIILPVKFIEGNSTKRILNSKSDE